MRIRSRRKVELMMKRLYQSEEWKRNRCRILALLASSPLTYKELKTSTVLSDSVLSNHLKKLMDEGMIGKVMAEAVAGQPTRLQLMD